MKPWERQWEGEQAQPTSGKPWEKDWQQDGKPTDRQKVLSSGPVRVAKGAKDIVDAGAQMLTNALPGGVVEGVNKATGFVNSLPVLGPVTKALGMTPASTEEINQGIAQSEQEYQAARQATAPADVSSLVTGQKDPGFDLARAGGNVVGSMLAVPSGPAGATMAARAAIGALAGGASGALQPVTQNQENFWSEKAKQAGTGALVGGVAAPVVGGIARMIRPNTNPQVAALLREGVTPTPGQIMGGAARTVEDKMTSFPLVGDAIQSARGASLDELNRAVYNRALRPIGQSADNMPVGREGVAMVQQRLRDAYDNLLPNLSFKADQGFAQNVATITNMVRTLPRQVAREFDDIYRNEVVQRMTPQGLMNGRSFKDAETALGQQIRRLGRDPDRHTQQLADAVRELRNTMRDTLTRSNPQHAQELQAINQGYSNFARIRDAGSRLGDKSGGFSPADLASAVRKADTSVGKGRFATGEAQMQDLSDAAVATLPSKYPDSGTTGRALMNAGAAGALGGGGYMASPLIPGAAALSVLPYLPGGRQLVAALLARRPAGAGAVAEGLRRATPKIAAGVAPAVQQLSE